ncbi:GNAT family N-acetyltransferase [Zunongwangia sp. F363]|uniref:GNAT family N-acetyltransferase n=1 Tax=Autumnicola tepida TaxID=3075595 RepID=A0ABU3CF29_9FLAO|nr:GNAT family N-acetyltransferase [Zunongwangia sp. F363]MDT0644964.1 GNAT family N-acetyltransferase [Zunongwangia sp. F363]
MSISVCFKPTKDDLSQIKLWLKKEIDKNTFGFYDNWDGIEESFHKGNLVAIKENNFPVGFFTYRISEKVVHIIIASIKETHRKKGFGKILINEAKEYFKKINQIVIELYCQPVSSESFWKTMSFKHFPEIDGYQNKIQMYFILKPHLTPTNDKNSTARIKLWDVEPHQIRDYLPQWIWEVKFKSNSTELEKPIIFPVDSDWNIELEYQGKQIEEHKVKKCRNVKLLNGTYILINKLQIT